MRAVAAPATIAQWSWSARYLRGMPRSIGTNGTVGRAALVDFLAARHRAVLVTTKADGGPQLSPVTCGIDAEGRLIISTYPKRAKVVNVRRNPRVSACVLSDGWDDQLVQVDGTAEVIDLPAVAGVGRQMPGQPSDDVRMVAFEMSQPLGCVAVARIRWRRAERVRAQ